MRGKAVFYPVGWDDNGLTTERRVQNYYGIRCEPSLPYEPGLSLPPAAGPARRPDQQRPVSRRNFVELSSQLIEADEREFERAWRRLGLSVDWTTCYRTIAAGPAEISQRAFLRDLARGDAYAAEAPVLWDVTFGTAVAQAEIEDRQRPGSYWRLAFDRDGRPGGTLTGREPGSGPAGEDGSGEVIVATTRPELLPGCVALVAHPADERYRALVGTHVSTPVFGARVPVLAHRLADPAKGTGLAMVCTFGDTTDVTWWRELQLDTRPVIGPDGRLLADPPSGLTEPGRAAYEQLAGLPVSAARRRVTELLAAAGRVRGDPAPVEHAVKFFEKGEAPLEIITTRQWYIRNGGRDPELRAALLGRGRELDWHPEQMRARYENWVSGLSGDWLISRQRYLGVPIPLWYRLDASGAPDYGSPIVPDDASLPVDPAADLPPGYAPGQRGVPGGFAGERDVMDTWATSSLSPQIAGGWSTDEDLYRRVFPMDLHPQAHEIIRTWLFYSVLRSHAADGRLPWRNVAISGWILDPDRKKMSKSAGNVVTPADLLDQYGTDAVRYWAASARLGVDTTFDQAQLRIGRRLAVKLLNAGKFVLGLGTGEQPGGSEAGTRRTLARLAGPCEIDASMITEPLDRALLGRLADVTSGCTKALESYDHAHALAQAERFWWLFCDDYLELVKPRGYGELDAAGADSAVATLRAALSASVRLLAPFLPFVTEEVWSWWPGQQDSVHRSPWPDAALLRAAGQADSAALDVASAAIGAVRKAKSQAKVPMRTPARLLTAQGSPQALSVLATVLPDVQAAGRVASTELLPAGDGDEGALQFRLRI